MIAMTMTTVLSNSRPVTENVLSCPEELTSSQVVINEVMAANTNTIADPQGEYDDWIELYNTGTTDVNLAGMYLTDKADNRTKWQFPDNTVISAGGYLIVWADENSKATPGVHTNFKLSADGEMVMLVNSDGNGNAIMDSVSFGAQADDISYGRYPNGSGSFRAMGPTPGVTNGTNSVDESESGLANASIKLYPNPFNENVNIEISINTPGNYDIAVYDMMGRRIRQLTRTELTGGIYNFSWDAVNIDGDGIAAGTYLLRLQSESGNITEQFVYLKN